MSSAAPIPPKVVPFYAAPNMRRPHTGGKAQTSQRYGYFEFLVQLLQSVEANASKISRAHNRKRTQSVERHSKGGGPEAELIACRLIIYSGIAW